MSTGVGHSCLPGCLTCLGQGLAHSGNSASLVDESKDLREILLLSGLSPKWTFLFVGLFFNLSVDRSEKERWQIGSLLFLLVTTVLYVCMNVSTSSFTDTVSPVPCLLFFSLLQINIHVFSSLPLQDGLTAPCPLAKEARSPVGDPPRHA